MSKRSVSPSPWATSVLRYPRSSIVGLPRGRGSSAILHQGSVTSLEHDVEFVAQSPFRLRRFEVEGGNHTITSLCVAHRLEDRVPGEVHLGYEPASERRTEQREMYVRRSPGVVVILSRVSPRLDRDEPVAAVIVAEAAAR